MSQGVSEREREKERDEGETRGYVQTSDSLPHLCTERQTASATLPARGKNWRRWNNSFITHKYLTCLVVADRLRAGNPKPS